ncbi:MAG TPA: hypothetical protein VKU02_31670 [Gemmataceae bacterium]|nr:hypothetical protein [Gemmataceae bacterium]
MGSLHPISSADRGPALAAAYSVLLHAWERAHDCHADPWEFAVEVADLRAVGLTTTELRWLARQGYVHHAEERTKLKDKQRVFGPRDRAVISKKSAFVLTAAGAKAAPYQPQVPFYDRELRQL